jgi:ribonuclease R
MGEGRRGGWRLLVAIADVSQYVRDGDALDREAAMRSTSVYFPRRVIPMLPEKLSNGLCSLNPQVDRLVLVCDMVINPRGQVKAYQFFEAVMHSAARLTYDEVWGILSGRDAQAVRRRAALVPHLHHLADLYRVLAKAREERGAMDFETVETKIVCDAAGRIERIEPRARNDAHKLIEECMLAANVCAADFTRRTRHPNLYRVHEGPTPERLALLREFLRSVALTLGGGDDPSPRDYAELAQKVRARPDAMLLQSMMLRSMQQAVYTPHNAGHFGLAYEAYAHFTSPIRRYPDLMTHRVIKALLHKSRYAPTSLRSDADPGAAVERALAGDGAAAAGGRRTRAVAASAGKPASRAAGRARALADTVPAPVVAAAAGVDLWEQYGMMCSANERRADEASRDVEAWLKCQYMRERVGEQFAGRITGVAPFGVFVTLNELYVEGLVHVSELGTEYFQYVDGVHELRGERTGRRFRLTDELHVQVSRVDLEARRIEFRLVQKQGYREVVAAAGASRGDGTAAPARRKAAAPKSEKAGQARKARLDARRSGGGSDVAGNGAAGAGQTPTDARRSSGKRKRRR